MDCGDEVKKHGGELLVEDRSKMQIVVAADITKIGQRSRWWAVINGASVVSRARLDTGCGPAITYLPAKHIKRELWVHAASRHRHTELLRIVEAVAAQRSSSWKIVDCTEDEFRRRLAQARRSHRTYNVVGIVPRRLKKDRSRRAHDLHDGLGVIQTRMSATLPVQVRSLLTPRILVMIPPKCSSGVSSWTSSRRSTPRSAQPVSASIERCSMFRCSLFGRCRIVPTTGV